METKFTLARNSGLNPSIVASLKTVPVDGFSYQYYKLRHPGAIYNLMSSKLVDSISMLCKDLNERKVENIKSKFRLVLYDFFQFYESFYEIMLCFCGQHKAPKDNEPIHSWLKNRYNVGEDFYKYTSNYLQKLRMYYNEIKHSSNEVQFMIFKNSLQICPAYFLDMPKNAYQGPVEPVSLNRELKAIYFLIYMMSDKLNDVLSTHLETIYGFQLLLSKEHISDDAFQKLNNSINLLTDFYLLSEIGMSAFKSRIDDDNIVFAKTTITEDLFDDYYGDGFNLEMKVTHNGYDNSYFVPSCGIEQIKSSFYYKNGNGVLRELKVIEC
ncbi:MAG: hypothetical protein EOO43_19380 [Flavobacterium sp.]|nr:MAG: hypothetical protein EOO43_19380 [Flavobacterium sp.]